jgi:hypothetical protein
LFKAKTKLWLHAAVISCSFLLQNMPASSIQLCANWQHLAISSTRMW